MRNNNVKSKQIRNDTKLSPSKANKRTVIEQNA